MVDGHAMTAAWPKSSGTPMRPTGSRAAIAAKTAALSRPTRSHSSLSTQPGERALTRIGAS